MFWRRKPDQSKTNRLRDEARPNELRFDASAPNEFAEDELEGDELEELDELEDEELGDEELDELEDATYEDEPIEDDEADAANRAAELQAEVQRMAEEFGLAGSGGEALYGPNGEEVARFIERLPTVSDEELEEHFDAWDSVPRPERHVAALAAEEAERDADLSFETESARRAVATWVTDSVRLADDRTGDAERFYAEMGRAVSEAAVALVLRPELDEADFEVLGGAWAEEVAGRPAPEEPEQASDEPEAPIEEGEFGPNTDLVTELLDRLKTLSDEEIAGLVSGWREQPQRELRAAHRELQEIVKEDEEWREQVRRAQERVTRWVNSEPQPRSPYEPRTRGPIRPDAAPAIADAVAAIVLADLLDADNAELLYDPWYQAVGEPELPLDDEEGEDEDGEDGEGEPADE